MSDLVRRLREIPFKYRAIGEEAAATIEAMESELAEWRKLKDPLSLHVSLLRGLPAKLSEDQLRHILGDFSHAITFSDAVAGHTAPTPPARISQT